jgi:hypothetical protein
VGSFEADGTPKLISFGDGNFVTIGENGEDDWMQLKAKRFHFIGGGIIAAESSSSSAGPQLRLKVGGSGGQEWVFVANGQVNGPVGDFQIVQQDGGSRMVITTNGNVGIGTTTPAARLDVAGTVKAVAFDGPLNAASLGSGTMPDARLSANVALRSGGNTFDGIQVITGGNVGVGTTSPDRPLSVRGIGGNAEWLSLKDTNGATKWHLNHFQSGLNFAQSGVADGRLFLATNGNVGIGTSTPATKLHLAGSGDTELSVQSTDNNRRWTLQASGNGTADRAGSFQIIDRTAAANRLLITTSGNVGIGTATPATKLEVIGEITTTAVNITSDRNAKEAFAPVNARDILAKVAALPISEWQYKTQGDARHIGPMAQDFREAFGTGRDDKHITSVDADGVALAAIQGLNEKLEDQLKEKDSQIDWLRTENRSLAERLAAIERALGMSRNAAATEK